MAKWLVNNDPTATGLYTVITGRGAVLFYMDSLEKARVIVKAHNDTLDDADPFEGAEITKATELQRYGQYVVQIDKVVSAEAADHILRTLKARFPTNSFAVAGPNTSVMEVAPPPAENTRLVLREELLAALDEAHTYAQRLAAHAVDSSRVQASGAELALSLLCRALKRDGAATPPAEQPPKATPAATGAGTADESATGVGAPAAAPSPPTMPNPAGLMCLVSPNGRICQRNTRAAHTWHMWEDVQSGPRSIEYWRGPR